MRDGFKTTRAELLIHAIVLFSAAAVSFLLTFFGFADSNQLLMSFIWSTVFLAASLLLLNSYPTNSNEKFIIMIAFLLRIAVLIFDYQNDTLSSILHMRDCEVFESVAKAYYNGYFLWQQTHYPYVINVIFHFVGCNVFIVRLVNVYLSIWSICITSEILYLLQIKSKYRKTVLLMISFAPFNIVYNVLLLRESIYLFCITSAFASFIKWKIKEDDFYVYLALAYTLPAAFLHSGYLSFSGVIGFYFLFDKSKKSYKRVWTLVFRAVIVLTLVIIVSQFKSLTYILKGDTLFTSLQTSYSQHYNQGGGSQYLTWMTGANIFQMILYTPIRMFFFLTSPFILDWRRFSDIITFFADSVFHLGVLTEIIRFYFRHNKYRRRHIDIASRNTLDTIQWGSIFILLTSLIFCWGTTTAGAAIRHRNCLFSIECILLACTYQALRKHHFTAR